ncbi:hypothetical protein [Amycolatopsis cihanbeyliensis]|uniref:Dolichyl-phosphate-mannose-protein mannosyltransferase n=1 Tax=Amycolatopsis cihanbeyliensis TaxID=1128664 RepID=A0A542DM40_AMYCI|nr:hypothetical protein [Amycolatopsis cihanbeyliensis]TQJ04166.1 hypothetical protein FB471_3948 [Amycolatopsis cihanbeyliensis]
MIVVAVAAWLVLAVFVLLTWSRINTHKGWRVGVLLLACAFSLAHQLMFSTVAEDAYISFRYALNIAEGNGPVFNPGERVEGYSNFLWVITLGLLKAVFGLDIVGSAVVLGVLCTLGCVVLAYLLVNRVVRLVRPESPDQPAFGIAAAVLTAAASGLAAYGPSGLETPLFLLLTLGLCLAVTAERFVIAGVLVALATMTRPDGVVVGAIVGLWLLLAAARNRASWWAPAGYVLGALVLAVPWTAWRVTYYGYLIPNALAAKMGAPLDWQLSRGWDYLSGFTLAHEGFLLLAAAMIVALLLARTSTAVPGNARARSLVWLVFAIAFGYLAFITYAGGDWMPAWRLLAPVPPLLAVASAAAYGVIRKSADTPSPRPRGRLAYLVPMLVLTASGLSLIVSTVHPLMLSRMHAWRDKIAEMSEIGSWFADRLPAGTVISTFANGVLSYRAGPQLIMVDVLGLTDEHIARHGSRIDLSGAPGYVNIDYDYVVNVRRPALAVVTGSGYADRQRCGADPVYAGRYQVATFRRAGTDKWVAVYPLASQSAGLIETLDADPRFEHVPCAT